MRGMVADINPKVWRKKLIVLTENNSLGKKRLIGLTASILEATLGPCRTKPISIPET